MRDLGHVELRRPGCSGRATPHDDESATRPLILLGDKTSHGGTVISASASSDCNGAASRGRRQGQLPLQAMDA